MKELPCVNTLLTNKYYNEMEKEERIQEACDSEIDEIIGKLVDEAIYQYRQTKEKYGYEWEATDFYEYIKER